MTGKWQNNKTKAFYQVIDVVINATNGNDGQLMVLYKKYCDEDQPEYVKYVRDKSEFELKFTKIL